MSKPVRLRAYSNPGKREISRDKCLGTDCFLAKTKKIICKALNMKNNLKAAKDSLHGTQHYSI
jgi:hypothetical protein